MSDPIVGIDLGTSNTVVAHADGAGAVRVLADEAGYKIHPSVVSFHPSGGVVVGAAAKQRKVIDPQNTIYSVKRLIGRTFDSPEVQTAITRAAFQIKEGANKMPIIVTRGGEFAVPEISAIVLDHVRNVAAAHLDAEIARAVVTVPASFTDAQRSATATAGQIAGLTIERVLNEPTAAALAYGHSRQLRQIIAVYDFGGGTFDITILKLDGQIYEVLGTAGDSFLGGDDLDERIVDKMAEQFLRDQRIDLRNNEISMMRLRAVAEQTKIELSRRSRAVVRIDEIAYGPRGAPLNLQIEVSRDEFVSHIAPLVNRTFPVCQDALHLAGIGPDQVDDVILVGGTTKIPYVRDQVTKFFGKPPRTDVSPEEAVAAGAALQAASLEIAARLTTQVVGAPTQVTQLPPPPSSSGATNPAATVDDFSEATRPSATQPTMPSAYAAPAAAPTRSRLPDSIPIPADALTEIGAMPTIEQSTSSARGGGAASKGARRTAPGAAVDRIGSASGGGGSLGDEGAPTDASALAPVGTPLGRITRPGATVGPSIAPMKQVAARTMFGVPSADAKKQDAQKPAPPPVAQGPFPTQKAGRKPVAPPPPTPSSPSALTQAVTPPFDVDLGSGLAPLPASSTAPGIGARSSTLDLDLLPPVPSPAHGAHGDAAATFPSTYGLAQGGADDFGDQPSVGWSLGGDSAPNFMPTAPPNARTLPPHLQPPPDSGSAPLQLPNTPTPLRSIAPPPAQAYVPPPAYAPQPSAPPPQPARTTQPMGSAPSGAPAHYSSSAPLPLGPMPNAPPVGVAGANAPTFPPPQPMPYAPPVPPAPMYAMPPPAPVILDVTPRGLGIGTVSGFCEELIRRNARLPTEIKKVFTTSREMQESVRIIVCQGESRRLDQNVVLGDLFLEGLPPRPRGATSIEVTFSIDASGILNVRARDAETGAERRASLDIAGAMASDDVASSRERIQQLRR